MHQARHMTHYIHMCNGAHRLLRQIVNVFLLGSCYNFQHYCNTSQWLHRNAVNFRREEVISLGPRFQVMWRHADHLHVRWNIWDMKCYEMLKALGTFTSEFRICEGKYLGHRDARSPTKFACIGLDHLQHTTYTRRINTPQFLAMSVVKYVCGVKYACGAKLVNNL